MIVDFNDLYQRRHGTTPEVRVTKQQLAQMLERTPRWIELKVNEGMPSEWDPARRRRMFRPSEVNEWLKASAA